MNKWYIDRSKNLTYDNKKFVFTILNTIDKSEKKDTPSITKCLPEDFRGLKNPAALFTFLRDIGMINKKNQIGDSARLFLENEITYEEMVFELLFKRPAKKYDLSSVKPFPLVIMVLYKIYENTRSLIESYITMDECQRYLMPITKYEEVNERLIESIINDRLNISMAQKVPIGSLDILFNSWKSTALIGSSGYKDRIYLEEKGIPFAKYLARSCSLIKTPSINTFEEYFNYLGNIDNGLFELIELSAYKEKERIESAINSLRQIEQHHLGDNDTTHTMDNYSELLPFLAIKNLLIIKLKNVTKTNKR